MKMRSVLGIGLFLALSFTSALADETIKVDTSPQAVEAAYQSVREGTAEKVVTLKETAETMLVKLINAATVTGEFIADQVPIVIKELLAFNTAWAVVCVFWPVVFFIPAHFIADIFRRKIKWETKQNVDRVRSPYGNQYDPLDWLPGVYLPYCFAGAIWFLVFILNIVDLLKITLAPRVWLIEYAASLVK